MYLCPHPASHPSPWSQNSPPPRDTSSSTTWRCPPSSAPGARGEVRRPPCPTRALVRPRSCHKESRHSGRVRVPVRVVRRRLVHRLPDHPSERFRRAPCTEIPFRVLGVSKFRNPCPPPRAPCWPAGLFRCWWGACRFCTAWAGLRPIHHHHRNSAIHNNHSQAPLAKCGSRGCRPARYSRDPRHNWPSTVRSDEWPALVFLLVFWALAGACQKHGVGGFLLSNSSSSSRPETQRNAWWHKTGLWARGRLPTGHAHTQTKPNQHM